MRGKKMDSANETDRSSAPASGSSQGASRLHRSRLAVIGLAAGLAAAIGAGVVTMAQDEPAVTKAVTGEGRLPWDDATADDSPYADQPGPEHDGPGRHLGDRMHDRMAGPAGGPRGPEDGPEFAGPLHGPRALVEAVAEELGIEVTDLVAQLRDGTSIAEIAKENNVDVEGLIDSLVERVTAEVRERITELVNRTPDTAEAPGANKAPGSTKE